MAGKGKESVTETVRPLAEQIAMQVGVSIWDSEFQKVGSDRFLRFLIDKEGGVSIQDCEAFSRAIDGPLDELDPIAEAYCLEVSSPGLGRQLKKEEHLRAYLEREIRVKFYQPVEGDKEAEGFLESISPEELTLRRYDGSHLRFLRAAAADIRVREDFD